MEARGHRLVCDQPRENGGADAGLTPPEFLLASLALVILFVLGWLAVKRERRLATAFAWLLLPLAPTLNLRWMNQDDFLHDRYLYLSMLGVALLAGSATR